MELNCLYIKCKILLIKFIQVNWDYLDVKKRGRVL